MIAKILIALTFVSASSAFAQTANPGLSDGEIAKVLVTINQGEVDAAKIAKDKAQNAEVKAFAKMMIDDHKKNEAETKKLIKSLKSDTKDNDIAKSIETNAHNANDELKKADKTAFDKAYLAQQITMHEQALDKLTNMLIPGAKDAAFKAHLEKTRGAVQSHLEHAKTLNSKLM